MSTKIGVFKPENVSRETLEKKYVELLEIQRTINTMVQQVEEQIYLPF